MRWLYIGVVFGCVVFRQFWQGQLPAPVASILSKLFYWPFMPITVYTSTCIRNWWDEVIPESQVYIGAVPLPWMGHIDMLDKQLSIVAVVNMMVEDRGPVEEYTLRNITQLHLPTPDHMEPSLKDIEQGVEFIKQHSVMLHSEKDKANIEKDYEGNRRGGVYVHCKGGVGRSATVVFCWLLETQGWGLRETQRFLESRRAVARRLYSRPNIRLFYEKLEEKRRASRS